jgi:hypothetical protein
VFEYKDYVLSCISTGEVDPKNASDGSKESACLGYLGITKQDHRHLSNIDCLMACTACLICFIRTVNGHSKKKEKNAKNVSLVAGT